MSKKAVFQSLILTLLSVVALLAISAPAWAVEFLVNERNASTIYVWDPDAATESPYHTVQNNDADINVPEGSPDGWFVEHFDDEFGDFTPGSGSGTNNVYSVPYAYPKHVTVFDGAVFIMDRNAGSIHKYDLAGNELDTFDTSDTGQGMATDGSVLYASFWDGADSHFETFDSDLNPLGSFSNPTGLPSGHNNIVDLAYDPVTDTFYGLSTTGEGGTTTETMDVVEFTMGGSVSETFTLSFLADGIGQFVTEGAGEAESRATFAVDKIFDDGNTSEVEVTISCNTGLPLEQTTTISEGDGVVFVVTDFNDGEMDCEVTETAGIDGYAVEYDNGTVLSDESCVFEAVAFEEANTCVITNTLLPVDVEVTKIWIDENPQFNAVNIADAEWECTNVSGGGTDDGLLDFFGDPDTATDSFSVLPDWESGTTCSVTEVNVPDGDVEVDDSECQSLLVFPGTGASCTIFNTRLFAGIPTLSQYGLAVLALLMLGMGFVAYRRLI